ncbi:MAG: gluconate 2-dehydrogenase subunit 3 family protein [Gemmatimonadaceae bacterium]
MNRRDAIRNIGLLLGTAVTPTVARAVSAGYVAPAAGQPLRALSMEQNELVATLAELIIPTTTTPGARAARVDAFVDGLLADVFTREEKARFLAGLADVDARARAAHGVTFVAATPARQTALLTAMDLESRKRVEGTRAFFPWLKELTLVGYYTSEIGASQELKYVHVAGRYDGDVPYARVGRAYS